MTVSYLIWFFAFLFTLSGVQEIPSFKGGQNNLDSFIENHLIYPEYSKYNCLQGTVQIGFQLNRSGRIYNSEVEKGYGTDLDEEALRVIRLTSGRWIVPKGFDTTQYLSLPINFSLHEYDCESKSKEEIRDAIAAYKSRKDLTNVILNYYSRKSSGNSADEQKILELKTQLGYTEKFIDRTIRQGQQKLRQGDKESACEDFTFVKLLGSNKADKLIEINCSGRASIKNL